MLIYLSFLNDYLQKGNCDHHKQLKEELILLKAKPYRYPHMQKAEIEKQVEVMFAQGLIRESTSSFSAPVILV